MESQPVYVALQIVPKIISVLFYFLFNHLVSNLLAFITVIIVSAMDFWIVKNIIGRKLLALRWWT